ncbi:DUF4956 domain-containing protein [Haloferula chungangensis]|uniref:DUF4956 domain-containing protein n=1 Tax=Haloferula chungangensis TaxID=1048331 RepID=A0ABW2L2T7_9BACT
MDSIFEAFKETLGQDRPTEVEVIFAMVLSLVLNLTIGTVYKSTYRGTRYSQDYVQTLVIMGLVTTILIMVVSGNMSIAFGMFAAFSVIRFRRNLGQARDLGFVLFAMATGMVVGARFYSMAVLTTLITSAMIIILTRMNAFAPQSLSHQLRIRVANDINYDVVFLPIFEEFTETAELSSVETVQAGMMTELTYGVRLKEGAELHAFVERLQLANGNDRILVTTKQGGM